MELTRTDLAGPANSFVTGKVTKAIYADDLAFGDPVRPACLLVPALAVQPAD